MDNRTNALFREALSLVPKGQRVNTPELFFGAARRLILQFGSVKTEPLAVQVDFLLHESAEPPALRARLALSWTQQMLTLKQQELLAA